MFRSWINNKTLGALVFIVAIPMLGMGQGEEVSAVRVASTEPERFALVHYQKCKYEAKGFIDAQTNAACVQSVIQESRSKNNDIFTHYVAKALADHASGRVRYVLPEN